MRYVYFCVCPIGVWQAHTPLKFKQIEQIDFFVKDKEPGGIHRRPPLGFLPWKSYTDIDGAAQRSPEGGDFMAVNTRDDRRRVVHCKGDSWRVGMEKSTNDGVIPKVVKSDLIWE